MSGTHAHVYMWRLQAGCLLFLVTICSEIEYLTEPELTGRADKEASPRDSPVPSMSQHWEDRHVLPCPGLYVVAGI